VFWESYLKEHFTLEENHLFPFLSDDHPMKEQALELHQQIKAYFEETRLDFHQLRAIKNMVNQHIRFEEREFFMFIQDNLRKVLWPTSLLNIKTNALDLYGLTTFGIYRSWKDFLRILKKSRLGLSC